MKYVFLKLTLVAFLVISVYGQVSDDKTGLHIQKCNSKINYPTEGDESLTLNHDGFNFHLRILHPQVIEGPHFSTPFFWVTKGDELNSLDDILTLPTHIAGLAWHSINGYFFAQKDGEIRGYFIEDGFDNADNGSSGLIFVYDGKVSSAWRWNYDRDPNKKTGAYQISSADAFAKPIPPELLKTLTPVLELAEREANAWPGP